MEQGQGIQSKPAEQQVRANSDRRSNPEPIHNDSDSSNRGGSIELEIESVSPSDWKDALGLAAMTLAKGVAIAIVIHALRWW